LAGIRYAVVSPFLGKQVADEDISSVSIKKEKLAVIASFLAVWTGKPPLRFNWLFFNVLSL
jgi:hypothetical protein